MTQLDSTSTLDEVRAAYADNASYAQAGSIAMAQAFVTACRFLILMLPAQSGRGGALIQLNPQLIQQEKAAAERWIGMQGGGTGGGPAAAANVRHFSFENLRD